MHMASSKAATVEAYMQELPKERREVVAAVRALVNLHLPQGYAETMRWGMISWEIPLARYPATHNKQPLGHVALAAQKNHYALYLMGVYAESQDEKDLRQAYARAGRKLDMGKSCLRFRKLDELLAEEVGAIIASMQVDACIAHYEASRART
jgi:hypothetical protein